MNGGLHVGSRLALHARYFTDSVEVPGDKNLFILLFRVVGSLNLTDDDVRL